MTDQQTRRSFFRSVGAGFVAASVPLHFGTQAHATVPTSSNDRLKIGAIGMNNRGTFVTRTAVPYGDVVAICEVDRQVAEKAKATFGGKARLYEDYRQMFATEELDIVIIGTPDHWHTAMVIAACEAKVDAGKGDAEGPGLSKRLCRRSHRRGGAR